RLHDEYGVEYDALTQGAGEVNGLGALLLAYFADTAQAPGATWMTAVDPHSTFGTEVAGWSQDIIWGTNVLRGPGVIGVNQPAWAQDIVWGTGDVSSVLWGSLDENDILWGSADLYD